MTFGGDSRSSPPFYSPSFASTVCKRLFTACRCWAIASLINSLKSAAGGRGICPPRASTTIRLAASFTDSPCWHCSESLGSNSSGSRNEIILLAIVHACVYAIVYEQFSTFVYNCIQYRLQVVVVMNCGLIINCLRIRKRCVNSWL